MVARFFPKFCVLIALLMSACEMGAAIEVPTHSPQKEIDHSPCASALVERSHTLFSALDPWRPYVVEEDSACWMGHVLIADAEHDRVLRFDASAGSFVDEPLSRISGFLDRPSAFGTPKTGPFTWLTSVTAAS